MILKTDLRKLIKMKKRFFLLFTILFCGIYLTYCQHKTSKEPGSHFTQPTINPAFYQLKNKHKIDLQDTDIQHKIHALDCYFEEKVKMQQFNASVFIAYKGTPIFERYYGYKNYYTFEKLTPKSTFQIASTTKTFTSAAILLLVQQNLLSLEDTLNKFFPNFPYSDITVRMLLNHRSGLPNYLNFSETYWKNKKEFMKNEDVLAMLYKFKPAALNTPNTHFRYNNTNYVLLALLVEKISGMPFCDFTHQNIFLPIGMSDSWYYDPLSVRNSATKGYKGTRWMEDEIVYTDGVLGDKGIYSTVRDLYKWDQALNSGKFIKPELLGLAYTPQSFEKYGNKNYGLGWRMTDQEDGTRIIYHNGWWHSYNSVFSRKINDQTTVIILSNHYNQSVYKIQPIWDILYGNGCVTTDDESGANITKKLNNDSLKEIKEEN